MRYLGGLSIVLFCCLVGSAQAAPWWGKASQSSLPATTAATTSEQGVVEVAASSTPTAQTDLETYRRAQELLVSKDAIKMAEAAKLFAQVAATGADEELASQSRKRVVRAINDLAKLDPSLSANTAVAIWDKHESLRKSLTSILESTYRGLAVQSSSPTTTLASLGDVGTANPCTTASKRYDDLVRISGTLGKIEDNAKWRAQYAGHLKTCNPTPESFGRAYALYAELNKADEARDAATRAADAYQRKFFASWAVDDFGKAIDYLKLAGNTDGKVTETLMPVARQAEENGRWQAAHAAYLLLGLSDDAKALEPMLGPVNK